MQDNKAKSKKTFRFMCMRLISVVISVVVLGGCAATRSDLSGTFIHPTERNIGANKVSVFFLFQHMKQEHGFDSIPKLHVRAVKDFDNLFRDALVEISNISSYATFTESPTDVGDPKRRQDLEKMVAEHDYTIKIVLFEESSFKQQCLSGTISLLSLTIIPMPYTWDYTITAYISDKSGKQIGTYQRKASLDNWMQAFLVFAYPFYPIEGKREEIYEVSLHDIFRQVETEKVLKK
jgi:hypothetical protein